jgi:hypothetical protein
VAANWSFLLEEESGAEVSQSITVDLGAGRDASAVACQNIPLLRKRFP